MNWRDGSSQLTRKLSSILEQVEDSRDHREVREEVGTDKQPAVLEREFIYSCHLPTFNTLILTLYMFVYDIYVDFSVISVKCCIVYILTSLHVISRFNSNLIY